MHQPKDRVAAARRDAHHRSSSPRAIEEEIAHTRVRLSATIDALERELAPNRVLEKSAELLRSSLEAGPGCFREQAWVYTIPLALIATGLGWLFMLRRGSSDQGDPPISARCRETGAVQATRPDPIRKTSTAR
jgi:hypothetical protein